MKHPKKELSRAHRRKEEHMPQKKRSRNQRRKGYRDSGTQNKLLTQNYF